MRARTTRSGGGRERRALLLPAAFLAATGFGGCDFLDPTAVENPLTTDEDLAAADEPVDALMPGLRAQFARMVGSHVVISEVISDNYAVHGTGLNAEYNNPRAVIPNIVNSTGSAGGIYWNTQELRALSDFVLEEMAPIDDRARDEHLAEAHYYRGMAFIQQGENFTHVPVEEGAEPLPASELLQLGVDNLEASLSLDPDGDFALPARAALARAHRALGDAGAASQHAEGVVDAAPSLHFEQVYDAGRIDNPAWLFLVQRALKEMQPLPRLDFLDPKYIDREDGIAVAKAEEMHLILAEAALAGDALEEGRGHLVDALELALDRGTTPFVDDDERLNGDLTPRPRDSEIRVRADSDSPFREGLVLDRPGEEIEVPNVSGTSLDPDSVAALTDPDEVWHAFHLARQEIMIAEGRRLSDLGIRLPMMLREIDANPTVAPGDPGTEVVVPDYVPTGTGLNNFSPSSPYDGGELVTDEVTIQVDMNRVLAENRVSPFMD